MGTTEQRPAGDIQSLHRALDIMEAVAAVGEVGVTELAQDLGLAVSTVHNLLRTLARRNYLVVANGRYRLGVSVTFLASRWDPLRSLLPLVEKQMRRISQSTGQASFATVLVGVSARVLAYRPAPGPVTVSLDEGSDSNPLALATGRVMVAFARRSEWADFITTGGRAQPDWSPARWRAELESIVETGVGSKTSKGSQGVVAIGVPVWGDGGESVVCSVGCSVPGFLATEDLARRIVDELWSVTTELSAQIGCDPLPRPKPEIAFSLDDAGRLRPPARS